MQLLKKVAMLVTLYKAIELDTGYQRDYVYMT